MKFAIIFSIIVALPLPGGFSVAELAEKVAPPAKTLKRTFEETPLELQFNNLAIHNARAVKPRLEPRPSEEVPLLRAGTPVQPVSSQKKSEMQFAPRADSGRVNSVATDSHLASSVEPALSQKASVMQSASRANSGRGSVPGDSHLAFSNEPALSQASVMQSASHADSGMKGISITADSHMSVQGTRAKAEEDLVDPDEVTSAFRPLSQ